MTRSVHDATSPLKVNKISSIKNCFKTCFESFKTCFRTNLNRFHTYKNDSTARVRLGHDSHAESADHDNSGHANHIWDRADIPLQTFQVSSNRFDGGSGESNLPEKDKIKSIENIELSSRAIDAILINGRQSRPDNNIPYHLFDISGNRNFR